MPHNLMVVGTTSDAGKTVLTTALCRVLSRRGYTVAPFKAQNMSNNSMVTRAGAEIGRAQWVQSVAAGAEPEPAMNPILLKPGSDRRSHVVVMGRPYGALEATEFTGGREELARAAYEAYDDLSARYEVVVCEGAGSPAEINLRASDFVNMGLARHDGIAAILVGDIDRGGVFAAMHGTLALLDQADQALVCGLVVNKFRGDLGLLRPGLEQIERLTGRPVLGVVPWLDGAWVDGEDGLALTERPVSAAGPDALRVAVVALPRVSNVTDVDALCLEPGLDVAFVRDARAIASADVVVLPGTRATLADLAWLRERGLADAIVDHAHRGGVVLGICGGFQMLGRTIADPVGVEGCAGTSAEGLGLLDVRTVFARDKVLALRAGTAFGVPASGYEIHHGRVDLGGSGEGFPGGLCHRAVYGTMWHGSFEGDELRQAWLSRVSEHVGRSEFTAGAVSFAATRRERLDTLADAVEEHLDVDAILRLVTEGPPPGMPVVRGGLE